MHRERARTQRKVAGRKRGSLCRNSRIQFEKTGERAWDKSVVGRGEQRFEWQEHMMLHGERQKLWRHSSCECNLWAGVMCCSVGYAKTASIVPHRSAAAITSGLLAAGTLAKSGGHLGQPAGGLGSGGPAAWDHWQGIHQLPSGAVPAQRSVHCLETAACHRPISAHTLGLALSPLLWLASGAIPHQLLQLAWHGIWQAQARLMVGLAQLLAHHLCGVEWRRQQATAVSAVRVRSTAARPVAGHRSLVAHENEPAARTSQC